jgi:hypothetical protein
MISFPMIYEIVLQKNKPPRIRRLFSHFAPIAQLDRVPGFEPGG